MGYIQRRDSKLVSACAYARRRGQFVSVFLTKMSSPSEEDILAAQFSTSTGFLSSKLLFVLALCVPIALLGLFARKLVVSEQEKELRRLEKKKAKESRNKKK